MPVIMALPVFGLESKLDSDALQEAQLLLS